MWAQIWQNLNLKPISLNTWILTVHICEYLCVCVCALTLVCFSVVYSGEQSPIIRDGLHSPMRGEYSFKISVCVSYMGKKLETTREVSLLSLLFLLQIHYSRVPDASSIGFLPSQLYKKPIKCANSWNGNKSAILNVHLHRERRHCKTWRHSKVYWV